MTSRCMRMAKFAALMAGAAVGVGVPASAATPKRIAFMASSSQNGYNQAVWAGVQAAAKRLGNVQVSILDGQFNSTLQYNQVEDAVASKAYDGFILFPNDTVGLAGAVREAGAAGIKMVAVQFPIGPKLDILAPQVPGVVATVAAPPADGAKLQAEDVVEACKAKDPCRVVIVIGQKVYPFDNLRYQTYLDVLKPHANIKVVATVEGNYDPNTSMTGMMDVLQVNPHVDAVLSNADQQTMGVEMALKASGIAPNSMFLTAGGGDEIAVQAIKEGRWSETYGVVPSTMGDVALTTLVDALDGKTVTPEINADKLSPLPPIWTKKVLDAHPDFKSQWPG